MNTSMRTQYEKLYLKLEIARFQSLIPRGNHLELEFVALELVHGARIEELLALELCLVKLPRQLCYHVAFRGESLLELLHLSLAPLSQILAVSFSIRIKFNKVNSNVLVTMNRLNYRKNLLSNLRSTHRKIVMLFVPLFL